MPDSPFAKAVIMSVPSAASFRPFGELPHAGKLAARLPRQLLRSWYIMYFQLPWLPERSVSWVVPRLWRQWSPGYDGAEDVGLVLDAIGAPANWRAALGYYRATMRGSKPPARYADLHLHLHLHLHGADDGCASADYTQWVERVLPPGSRAEIVERAGHFMQLDRPDVVAGHILDFVGR